ncbi:MAG: class I SAM-dependent methyltransferase [Ruminococcaceae bacterium]|nr:class I SAM-dependent methyltransferase [Oscillospiraceae bacterium]
MSSYESFAALYDRLMTDVDYDGWCDYLEDSFARMKVQPKLVLELGCGTGNLTVRLAKRGYSMIGLDNSSDMLTVATEKSQDLDILYLLQDMTEFELYGTVDAVVCSLDCLNYLTEAGMLERCFSLVSLYLNPGGVFLFDLNTQYKMEHILAPETFLYDDDEVFYTWQSVWDEEYRECEYDLTFFVKDGETYRRFEETHLQKAYSVSEVEQALKKAGLILEGFYDGFDQNPVCEETERIFFVVKKG